MGTHKINTTAYKNHVAELQRHWENALTAEGYDAALIHAGSKLVSFLDDYEYPFRCNPHLLWWLPLTHHHDSTLLIRPGKQPKLFYYQPDDYWYSPPADPDAWWADEFEVVPVREADAWKQAGINTHTAYIGLYSPEYRPEYKPKFAKSFGYDIGKYYNTNQTTCFSGFGINFEVKTNVREKCIGLKKHEFN